MRTGRPKQPLILTEDEQERLQSLAHRARSQPALARRARVVLACAEGLANKGVDYSFDQYNAKILTEPVRQRADELKAEIIAGKITVPDYYKK